MVAVSNSSKAGGSLVSFVTNPEHLELILKLDSGKLPSLKRLGIGLGDDGEHSNQIANAIKLGLELGALAPDGGEYKLTPQASKAFAPYRDTESEG